MPRRPFRTALLLAPEPLQRHALRQALLGAGVERVLEAVTGAEALACMGSELVQLVLTPWEVPDMAGRPLLQALRNRGRNRGVPVLLLDAGLPRANAIAAVKAGAAGRLPLPADAGTVRQVLQRIAQDTAQQLAGNRGDPAPPRPRRAPQSSHA